MFTEFKEALASGDFVTIAQSDLGMILIMAIAVVVLIGLLVFTGNKSRNENPVKTIVYTGVALAISMVLSNIKMINMPQGGSVTAFSMLFVLVIGYFYGIRQGILAGIVYGFLQLIFSPYVVHPVQLLLDYPLAFGALGLSGLFVKQRFGMIMGALAGITVRLIMHVISGAIFFAEYAPEGMNPWLYSFWYNFTYIGLEGGLTIILLFIPVVLGAINLIKKNALA